MGVRNLKSCIHDAFLCMLTIVVSGNEFHFLRNYGLNGIKCAYLPIYGSLEWGLSLLPKRMLQLIHTTNEMMNTWTELGSNGNQSGMMWGWEVFQVHFGIGKLVFQPILWLLPFEFHDLTNKLVSSCISLQFYIWQKSLGRRVASSYKEHWPF